MKLHLLIPLAVFALILSACTPQSQPEANLDNDQQILENTQVQTGSEGAPMSNVTQLQIEDVTVGTGEEAVDGKDVTVHYTGTLTNGTKFDSSVDRGQPFTFRLGAGDVIQGWEQGVKGMKIGGKRKLTIPPSLGYGPMAIGSIPANSVLLFDVELLEVK